MFLHILSILSKFISFVSSNKTTIFISFVSSIIGGFIVTLYLRLKEKQRWQKVKGYLEEDWYELLNRSFLGMTVLLDIKDSDIFKSSIKKQPKSAMARDALNKNTTFYKEEVIKHFDSKYKNKILEWEDREWTNLLYTGFYHLINNADNLISRYISFPEQMSPKLLERLFQWKDNARKLLIGYQVFAPHLIKPLNACIPEDKRIKYMIAEDIKDYIIVLTNLVEQEINK